MRQQSSAISCIFAISFLSSMAYGFMRIALTLDKASLKDFPIITESILSSVYNASNIMMHVVACGRNEEEAHSVKSKILRLLSSCFPFVRSTVKSFVLPSESGFALQVMKKKTTSHWSSLTGADFARFFLPSLFPELPRLLYLDNDIIVTCCLEEVWGTDLGTDKIIGIALDDLKWATVTQFERQYNASHPLVIENIRRQTGRTSLGNLSVTDSTPITKKEFLKALPRYPNDGVLLIDVQRYNALKIFDRVDAIARANALMAGNDFVVGLGTQQFTVLSLHDKWVELTPRANLRHFPDMARGYLMWFYYNGLLHYAGQHKPREVCVRGASDNEHRLHTYTGWATALFSLHKRCASVYPELLQDVNVEQLSCTAHIPTPDNFMRFIKLVQLVSIAYADSNFMTLYIGSLDGDLRYPLNEGILDQLCNETLSSREEDSSMHTKQRYSSDSEGISKLAVTNQRHISQMHRHRIPADLTLADFQQCTSREQKKARYCDEIRRILTMGEYKALNIRDVLSHTDAVIKSVTPTALPSSLSPSATPSATLTHILARFFIHHSTWSLQVYDPDTDTDTDNRQTETASVLSSAVAYASLLGLNKSAVISAIETRRQAQQIAQQREEYEKGKREHDRVESRKKKRRPWKSFTVENRKVVPRSFHVRSGSVCDGTVDFPANAGVISCPCDAYSPSYERNVAVNAWGGTICRSILQDIKLKGHKHWDVIGVVIDMQPSPSKPFRSSLGVLRNFDLVFMRPKFVLVRLGDPREQRRLIDGKLLQSVSSSAPAPASSSASTGDGDGSTLHAGEEEGIIDRRNSCCAHAKRRRKRRSLRDDVEEALAILRRSGYIAVEDSLGMCGVRDEAGVVVTEGSRATEEKREGGRRGKGEKKSGTGRGRTACIWATRLTTLEFADTMKPISH